MDEPLVENSVCLAPTASANSSCAVLCTFQARSRVSSPWLIGRALRAPSAPRHFVNSGAGGPPPQPLRELGRGAAAAVVRGDAEREHVAAPEVAHRVGDGHGRLVL